MIKKHNQIWRLSFLQINYNKDFAIDVINKIEDVKEFASKKDTNSELEKYSMEAYNEEEAQGLSTYYY